jgi:hypothetical protein
MMTTQAELSASNALSLKCDESICFLSVVVVGVVPVVCSVRIVACSWFGLCFYFGFNSSYFRISGEESHSFKKPFSSHFFVYQTKR